MSDVPLGKLIEGDAERDAIHVAIAPVVAAEYMHPGEHVGFLGDDRTRVWRKATPIGIVDPFMSGGVCEGEKFYVLLYPQTVTGMRHHWQHPAFDEPPSPSCSKEESEAWLREFCKTHDCPDYDTILKAATGQSLPGNGSSYHDDASYQNDGEYLTFYGIDAHCEIPPEFWDHIERVTGITVPYSDRATCFSCSC